MRTAPDELLLLAAAAEIKARRTKIRISQEELAHRAGVHRSYIARLEVANTQPTLATLLRLADALEIEPADLVAGITERYARELRQVREP